MTLAYMPLNPISYLLRNWIKTFHQYKLANIILDSLINLDPSLLYDDKNNPGSSHASLHSGVFTDLESKPFTEQTIQLTTIDQFVDDNNISKITLLKIDTEGNEYNVLKGAEESIKKGIIDIIQFEFTEMNLFSRHFFNDFYELLIKDYKIYRLLPNSLLEIKNYHPPVCELFAFQNLIAIKRDVDL